MGTVIGRSSNGPRPPKWTLDKPRCDKDYCKLFGQVHPLCKAHNNRREPCGLRPMKGQFVCNMHGGRSEVGIQHGELRLILTEAAKLVSYDPDDDESIEEGLLREVRHSSQIAKHYASAIALLQGDRLVQKTPRDGEKLSALIEAWTAERVTHARLAKIALDAGIEQRKMDLMEQEAERVVYVFVQVFEDPSLGLTREQQLQARQVAARVMQALPRTEDLLPGDVSYIPPRPKRTSFPASITSR